jgi:hypothetical protein
MFQALVVLVMMQAPSHEDTRPDLPPLVVLRAFPWTYKQAQAQKDLHSTHVEFLERLRLAYPAWSDNIGVWIQETCDRGAAWQFLYFALDPDRSEEHRREALMRLRLILRERAFWKGDMPPMLVPVGYPQLYIPLQRMPPADDAGARRN